MEDTEMKGMIELIREDKELWQLFTVEKEYSSDALDQYGNPPYSASKNKSILQPRVSEYLISRGFKVDYPGDRKFAVCLTHDVDIIHLRRKEYLMNSLDALVGFDMRHSVGNLMAGLDEKNTPLKNFSRIMSLEEKYGAKSSFYFLALENDDEDQNYDISEMKDEIRQIEERGWEVGLHGGHTAYNNLEIIREEKKRLEDALGSEVIGYRNHYLKFRTPDTWELLSKAGLKYDTTFGYNDMVGFRNGMCHPFKPFNLVTGRESDILEIPLTLMDVTFPRFMGYDIRAGWDLTKKLIDITEKNNGVMTVLWHNDQMNGWMVKFYEKILRYCKDRNAWMTSGKEIFNWWVTEQRGII
jgi:peptidoglycan/xylan/chitin deacetylase (PgdA/CDA1 family)